MRRLLLVGEGVLCARLREALAELGPSMVEGGTPSAAPGDCVLLVQDAALPEEEAAWQRTCHAAGAFLLPVRIEGGDLLVGPWAPPAEPGCAVCLELRRQAVHPQKAWRKLGVAAAQWARQHRKPPALLTAFGWGLAAERVRLEVAHWWRGEPGSLLRTLWLTELASGRTSEHRFLPVPLCPVCGNLPADGPEAVEPPRDALSKSDRFSFRVADVPLSLEGLRERFVDRRTGLVANEFHFFDNDLLAFAAAELPLDFRDQREPGIGRSSVFAQSEFTGLLEALERYAGLRPLGKRTTVHGSYRELAPQAIDPAALILHGPGQYALPHFPFTAYHQDLPFKWVWGYSFQRRGPVLVPEQCAYYKRQVHSGQQPNSENHFVYEVSNGCALGGSLEEAILHGLFEVAERDGFLMTWYAQLPVPRVDPYSFEDREVDFLLDRLAVRGFRVYAFNTTFDFGIPSFWVMAVNQRAEGMRSFSAGGAHLDPLRALQGGLAELAAGVFDFLRQTPADREQARPMVEQPELVKAMRDHGVLYTLPEAFGRLDFLLKGGGPEQTAREAFPDWYTRGPSLDLVEDLRGCVEHFRRSGCEVVALEQTPPELRQAGLRAVKVLATGTLTMTFGHTLRRLEGATRLGTVPVRFGYRQEGAVVPLNPHPHPFP